MDALQKQIGLGKNSCDQPYLDDLCHRKHGNLCIRKALLFLQVLSKFSAWLTLTPLALLEDLVFHVTCIELLSLRVLQRMFGITRSCTTLPVALRGLCVCLLVCVLPL